MATIGQQLTAPESGWKRYDDYDPQIFYTGTWSRAATNASNYKSTLTWADGAKDSRSIKFKFFGSKLRLITQLGTAGCADITIKIDNITETFSQYRSVGVYQYIAYEKLNLSEGLHSVEIYRNTDGSLTLDAIDIDSTGRLLHPDEVMDLNDLTIGKRIRVNYKAPISGQVGSFSGLGQETTDFIPATSLATPSGDFYFIMVDEGNGKKKLIADRNIQHTISWDTLNNAGIASGNGLDLDIFIRKEEVAYTDTPVTSTQPFTKTWVTPLTTRSFDIVRTSNVSDQTMSELEVYDENGVNITSQATFSLVGLTQSTSYTSEGVKTGLTDGEKTAYKWDDNSNEVGENGVRLTFNNEVKVSKIVVYSSNIYTMRTLRINNYIFPKSSASTIRLLTGGISSTDKDNEWDQYIVSSTLNGLFTAGDNMVWNWQNQYSWTSTSVSAVNRTIRGYTGAATWYTSGLASSSSLTTTGFRPVLEIKQLSTSPIFEGSISHSSVHREDVNLTGTINNKGVEFQYSVLVNEVEKVPLSALTTTAQINTDILNSWLTIGDNTISIYMINVNGNEETVTFKITKTNTLPYGQFILTPSSITRGDVTLKGVVSNLPDGYSKDTTWINEGEVFIKPILK